MGRVIYSAFDTNNKSIEGYIEADSNEEAIQKLLDEGLHTIELHGDVFFSATREDLKGLGQGELDRIARFEQENQKNPSILTSFKQLLQTYKVAFLSGLLMIAGGFYADINWLWILGVLIYAGILLLWLYSYRNVWMFEEIYRQKTFGEFDKTIEIVAKLKKKLDKNPQAVFELDKIQAQIMLYRDGNLRRAKMLIDRHKTYVDEILPGMYENAEASLYYLLGDYKTFLEKLYQMYEKNPQNMFVMDLAFAEARYGDLNKALSLIEDVNSNALPSYGAGIYDWTLGVIAYRQKRLEDAREHFVMMMHKFDPFVNNPIIWEMIAVAAGTYADLLYDMGLKEEGLRLLQPGTIKILNLTADDILRESLSRKYPDYISKECYCVRENY